MVVAIMGSLLQQTILGFLSLFFILSLCLFLPAGSLAFWQAWLYLGVFFGCTLFITVYLVKHDQALLASRVKAGPMAETQKTQQLIQSLASLFFVALFVVSGLDFRFTWSHVPTILVWFSAAMVAFGFYIVYLAFKENSFASATIATTNLQKVISSGLYAVVRHPMYAGAMLMLFFSPLALGSWLALPCPLFLLFVIVVRLGEEEKYLQNNLLGYSEYCQRVQFRLVPNVW